MDKGLPCQVAHASCHLATETEAQLSQLTLLWGVVSGEREREGEREGDHETLVCECVSVFTEPSESGGNLSSRPLGEIPVQSSPVILYAHIMRK